MSTARQAALVRSTVGSHRIASSLELSRTAPHRTAPPSRAPPHHQHLLLQRQQKATEAQAHTLPSPCHQRTLRIRGRDEARADDAALPAPSAFAALRVSRPSALLAACRAMGRVVPLCAGVWLVAVRCVCGVSAVWCGGVEVWKCCSDAARVVQDARVVRDEMRWDESIEVRDVARHVVCRDVKKQRRRDDKHLAS
jgi:hypothetical protein